MAFLFIMEGDYAARTGASASENPYGLESEEGVRWHAGWLEARNDMKAAAPADKAAPPGE